MMGGKPVYRDGMGLDATAFVMRFLSTSKIRTVVDPFVGRGTVAAAANAFGFDAIGVELQKRQCAYAQTLKLIKTKDGRLKHA